MELQDVVNWKEVVLHLKVPENVVKQIEKDYNDKEKQKKLCFSWWMENIPGASWKKLATALLKADYSLLATRVMLQGMRINIVYFCGLTFTSLFTYSCCIVRF